MTLQVLGTTKDLRTEALVVYAQIAITDYLALIGDNFAAYDIQRRREKHRAYEILKKDIQSGTTLPAITLAVRPEFIKKFKKSVLANPKKLSAELSRPGQVNILDGLQRTYIIKDLADEGQVFDSQQKLLLEFWLEANIKRLIYRIIVLNSGQKKMSMRHQVELLFQTMKGSLQHSIPGLKLIQENEQELRDGPKSYSLDRVAASYQAMLLKTHEIKRDNVVTQQLTEEEAFEKTEDELGDAFDSFQEHFKIYSQFDEVICKAYTKASDGYDTPSKWVSSYNVMCAYFAAVGRCAASSRFSNGPQTAMTTLVKQGKTWKQKNDPMGFGVLKKHISSVNPRKINIGLATRKIIFAGFYEFFKDGGETPIRDLWLTESLGAGE